MPYSSPLPQRRQCRISTTADAKYLAQLCKHFAHKIRVDWDPAMNKPGSPPMAGRHPDLLGHEAVAFFPWGESLMSVGDDGLSFVLFAAEDDAADRMQAVIEDHVKRFAWREDLAFCWTP